jgi:arylsulfatase A-like enzyme/Flp pilus assembly protein TadD
LGVIRKLSWVVVLAVSAFGANPKKATSVPKAPNIILITLDTTRADRMGFLGSKRGLTPNLDAMAKQSAVFTRAYAQYPLTPPSHATILTGTYPQFHQVNDMQDPLAADVPYGPEILHGAGYQTAAFLGSIVLKPEIPYAPGFDRGFDTYDADFHDGGPGADRYTTVQRRGLEVVAHALAWMKKHPNGPFFVWVHMYDAHDPYDPPEPYKNRYAKESYDGGIAYEDAAVGRLVQELKLRGLYQKALISVMADHGESLGAHGEDTHGVFLYDETIHVPLLIKLPGATTGQRIEKRVELVDIMPTLLDESKVAVPAQMQGESLLGLIKGEGGQGQAAEKAWQDRPAYSQSEYPHREFGWSALRSLRTEKYLYVQAPRRELYDDAADPKAEHNLATSQSAVTGTLAAQLQALREKTTNMRQAPQPVSDPSAQAKLAALGYMASASNGFKTPADEGADPKDKIEIANMIHRADLLQEDMRADESIALLEQIVSENPTVDFYIKLGTWLNRKQDFSKAAGALRKALEMNPDATGARILLGKSLMVIQDYQHAIPEFEKVVAEVPNAIDAHSFLELAYARTNRVAEAIWECQIVLQYVPDDYGSYLIMGQQLALSGDPMAGIKALKRAEALQPNNPQTHLFLAEIYDQLGQKADADQERSEALHLQAMPQD